MFVGSIPSTHNKTFSSFSFCLRFFLSSPQNKSLQHDLLGAGHGRRKQAWGFRPPEAVAGGESSWAHRFLAHQGWDMPLHSRGVLVSLAVLKSHQRPSGLNNRHLFLTVLGAGKSKVKVKVDSGPEASSWPRRKRTLHSLPTWQKQRARARSLAPLPIRKLALQGPHSASLTSSLL